MNEIKNDCERIARDIGRTIEDIVDGKLWHNPKSGEFEPLPEKNEDGERLDEDGNEIETATLCDWINKQLGDVRFEVRRDSTGKLEVTGGRVLCCFGGPNVWAEHDEIRAYWGNESATYPLTSDASDAMLDMLAEVFGE